jgi:hypothetical protein
VLDGDKLDELRTRGFVRVPAFVAPDVAAGVADRVWALLGRRGIDRYDPATWPDGRPSKLQAISQAAVYRDFERALDPCADQVLGAGRWKALNSAGPLISFPEPGPWRLPHRMWHLDLPARGAVDPPVALRLLGLVEPVAAHGGGTLLVEGSHALIGRMVELAGGDRGTSSDARRALVRRYEWFRALGREGGDRDRFLEPTVVDGVTVRVVESVGAGGDAYLLHPWVVHGLAANTGDSIRSMLTHTVYRLPS